MNDLDKSLQAQSNSIFSDFGTKLATINPVVAGVLVAAVIAPVTIYAAGMNILEHQQLLSAHGPEAVAQFMKLRPDSMLQAIGQAIQGTSPSKWQQMQTLSLLGQITLPVVAGLGTHLAQRFVHMKHQIAELQSRLPASMTHQNKEHDRPSGATRIVARDEINHSHPARMPLSSALQHVERLNEQVAPSQRFSEALDTLAGKLEPRETHGMKGPRLG